MTWSQQVHQVIWPPLSADPPFHHSTVLSSNSAISITIVFVCLLDCVLFCMTALLIDWISLAPFCLVFTLYVYLVVVGLWGYYSVAAIVCFLLFSSWFYFVLFCFCFSSCFIWFLFCVHMCAKLKQEKEMLKWSIFTIQDCFTVISLT